MKPQARLNPSYVPIVVKSLQNITEGSKKTAFYKHFLHEKNKNTPKGTQTNFCAESMLQIVTKLSEYSRVFTSFTRVKVLYWAALVYDPKESLLSELSALERFKLYTHTAFKEERDKSFKRFCIFIRVKIKS